MIDDKAEAISPGVFQMCSTATKKAALPTVKSLTNGH